MALPEYIKICPLCDGAGEYRQTYTAGCGRGYYQSMGPCSMCGPGEAWKGAGYVYKATNKPAPRSVVEQIRAALAAEAALQSQLDIQAPYREKQND